MLTVRLKEGKASSIIADIDDNEIEDRLLDAIVKDLVRLQDERAKRVVKDPNFTDEDTEDGMRLLKAYGFDTSTLGDEDNGNNTLFVFTQNLQTFMFVFCVLAMWAYINLSSSTLAVNVRENFLHGFKGDPSKLKPRPIYPHEEGYQGFGDTKFDEATMRTISRIKKRDIDVEDMITSNEDDEF